MGGFAIIHAESPGPGSPEPNITVEPESLIFDTTAVGSSSVDMLSITNTGSDTLLIYNLFSPDSIFSVNTDSFNVLPGDNQIVLVTFVPNQPTDYSSDLFIVNNDLETDTLVVLLTGVGFILAPEISVAPIYLAFDTTAAGSSNLKLLTIYNTGNATLPISNISSTESVFSTNLTSYDIQPGDSQMVQVAFTPTEPIIYTSNFFVISNDSEMDTLIVPVSGVGIMLARIELDAQLPHILVLYPNYPNPFNNNTPEGRAVQKAGLRHGDYVVALDGKPFGETISHRTFNTRVKLNYRPGQKLNLTLMRKGKRTPFEWLLP